MQDSASERLQDQIVEEIKDSESTKTEEALQKAVKEHDLWMHQNEKEEAKRLQRVRKLRQDEEIACAPPKNMTKWPDWKEPRKLENGEWRLEPEGEAEVPQIIIVSDAVDGTPVDLEGESRNEQVEAKFSRTGIEMLNEGEEIRCPKRKVIRVESEEAQDYVREEKITEFEEEKQRTFIPCAVAVPLKPLFRCDKKCSGRTLGSWQLASVVVTEGDEAFSTNLCQKWQKEKNH